MVPLNGHALHLQVAFQDRPFFFNLMGPYSVLPITHFTPKNGDLSGIALYACSMPPALAIAAPVLCGHSVKNLLGPSSHDASVP